VMLLPSRYDAWGVALVEGGMAGLAMVGSDRTGSAEALVEEGKNGYVVRAGDADDLLRVMRLYASDRNLARRHGSAAQKTAERTAGETLAGVLKQELESATGKVAACFWEEHCTECGEPDCYRSCTHYSRGIGGRCRRFEGGLRETILCEDVNVRFLPWGKLEAFFHGRMVSRRRAEALERLMDRTAFVRRLFPRAWRSWRWRWALLGAETGTPTVWRVRAVAERNERLVLQVVDRDLRELTSARLDLGAGTAASCRLVLPQVGDGCLFRIFAADGEATGKIRFLSNTLAADGEPVVPAVKCVAWDLDGTLWDGTLSEGGDVRLRTRAVETVKALDAHGVVNSICSKNDETEAMARLKAFGIEEYFVFPQINWGPKSASLRNLAREMNIALDAIALVDDREENRAEVRTNCPGVRVLDERTGLEISSWGLSPEPPESSLGSFRRQMYREEMARRGAARGFGGDAAAFLAQSELQVELLPVEGERVGRCQELVNRTNQLTIAARRYSKADFAALVASCETRAVHVRDKYGDYGIVGFAAWNATSVVELVFSCRVAMKGVERRVLDALPKGLGIDVVATARNAPIRSIVKAWQEARA